MTYKVKLDIFEGPLDLLLYLIKKNELNIHDIPIADITGQYLEYFELMRLLDLNIAGEFLVMAATLMQIKSKMLLPPDETVAEEEEIDPRDELVRRLLEYQKFKEAANHLKDMELARREVFTRKLDELGKIEDTSSEEETFFEASVFDLINAFTKALKNVPKDLFYEVIKDEFTVEGKIHDLLHLLLVKPQICLGELFGSAKSKIEIIVIFLAILELTRLKEIVARQKEVFGEIEIVRNTQNIKPIVTVAESESNPEEGK